MMASKSESSATKKIYGVKHIGKGLKGIQILYIFKYQYIKNLTDDKLGPWAHKNTGHQDYRPSPLKRQVSLQNKESLEPMALE